MKRTSFLLTFLLFTSVSFSQTLNDTIAHINKAMEVYRSNKPGAQLSIQKNGKIIFSNAYGLADLEHHVPLSMQSKIEAGSVSKQFTAAAILVLAQQGKLSLLDDVKKYIPEMKDYGTTITLGHLMHHTSGIKDWGAVASLTGWGRFTKMYTNDDALEIISSQKTLNNIPGAEYIYSNSNYNLLAIIVERVSKKSLQEFTNEYIFSPAGMSNTEWRHNHNKVVKDRAIAYSLTDNGYQTDMPNEDCYGNGGLLTTTEDLLKWNNFLFSGKFGQPSILPEQIKTEPFNNGKMNPYAAGLVITKIKDNKAIMHDGATAGYRCFLEHYPALNLSIAFLSNSTEFDTAKVRLEVKIRNILLPNQNTQTAAPEGKKITNTPSTINAYSGWYKNDRNGAGVKITVRDANLFIDNNMLQPQGDHVYKSPNNQQLIVFHNLKKMFHMVSQTDTIGFLKVETPTVNLAYLQDYLGRYFSAESNSFLTFVLKGDSLWLKIKTNRELRLIPTYKDGFNIVGLGGSNLYFTRDKNNRINGMKLSSARARNVGFEKIK